jgi:hypothetical protein
LRRLRCRGCSCPRSTRARPSTRPAEGHYQDALEAVAGGRTWFGVRHPLITAELVREPANPYDPNAVRIDAAGRPLAHVPKEDASRFHAVIDKLAGQGRRATCRAWLTGGWDRGRGDRGSIGLRILTGRWACQRCGRLWHDPRRPGRRWYDLTDDGPHVCPGCFSYAFTHPT